MMWVSNLIRTEMNVVMNCEFLLFFLRWKALNCKNYIIVLIFLYYAESRSLVKYDDCAFWELDTQNMMTGEKLGHRNIAISKNSEMLVWMLCVHGGFPLIMNGCWHSLLTESIGSAAIVVPVQVGGCLHRECCFAIMQQFTQQIQSLLWASVLSGMIRSGLDKSDCGTADMEVVCRKGGGGGGLLWGTMCGCSCPAL